MDSCFPCFSFLSSSTVHSKTNDTTPLCSTKPNSGNVGSVNDFFTVISTHSQGSKSLTHAASKLIADQVNSQDGTQRDFVVKGLIKQGLNEAPHQFQFQAEQNKSGIEIFLVDENGKHPIGKAAFLKFDDFRGL